MTPERAKELAEANGCEFKLHWSLPGWFVAIRGAYETTFTRLWLVSEADFVANLPDKRD